MPVLVIPKNVVLSGTQVPELNDFVDFGTWSRLSAAIRQAEEAGNCLACAIEWGVCCITGLWCVFCCHACIADGIIESKWRNECDSMNRIQFGGRLVFSVGPQCSVLVNTDNIGVLSAGFIPVSGAVPTMAPPPPTGYPAQPYGAQPYPAQPYPGQPGAQPAMATAVPVSGPRYVNVIVPPGVVAGSQLTISTPDNTSILVTVPAGMTPGQEFKVQY